ncbi:MAG: hypothetical protein J0H10_03380 [Alphaproteobacteria bacterium]|nr:hypothetical protein [Alphaproteobacteria bacterium]
MKEVGGYVFDFPRYKVFLEAKAEALRSDGMEVRFHCGPADSPKQGMILELVWEGMYGGFENWITGETDYTVMPVGKHGQPLAYRWGLIVTDESFAAIFDEFLAAFRSFAVVQSRSRA